MYVSHTDDIFSNWDFTLLRRLFALLTGFMGAYLLSNTAAAEAMVVTAGIIPVLSVFSLLVLLIATHVHYMMVRTETIALKTLRPTRNEFEQLVDDILIHEEFIRLKDFYHHTGHIYDHSHRVAFIAYTIAKFFSFDYLAAARGGLLHDFFLYDWRERKASDISRSMHGREHPKIALENARLHFTVSDREADIIEKHMFPKTWTPPRYLESAVVQISDKLAAVYEYSMHAVQHLKRR